MNRIAIGALALVFGMAALAPIGQSAGPGVQTKIVKGQGSATCPAGWKLTGGGVQTKGDNFGPVYSVQIHVTSSHPRGQSWLAEATEVDGYFPAQTRVWQYTAKPLVPVVYAICVR
jgi:hypothetical protein